MLAYIDADSNDSEDVREVSAGLLFLVAWPNMLAGVLFVVGAVYAHKAVQKWKENGSMLPIEDVSNV